jgi:integrase/N6-adenosine-specific RNA methylase IME4
MKQADLLSLSGHVRRIAAPAAHLYLWVTNNFLEDGLELARAWGFEYKTLITWAKDRFGLGQYFRGQTEHCIFAVKNVLPYKVKGGKRQQGTTLITAPRSAHSEKPAQMREYIERVSYEPRLELFGRNVPAEWDAIGLELESCETEREKYVTRQSFIQPGSSHAPCVANKQRNGMIPKERRKEPMSLYKRGNVYWTALWIDGERTMRSLGTSNRRQAETLEQRLRDELHTKRFQLPNFKPEMLFGELYARFLAEGEVKAYHLDRAKQLLPFFSETPIGTITKNDIARYRKHRHNEHRRKAKQSDAKPLSETTVNRDIEVIRHLLFWAVDEGFIPANPIARIRMVRERGKRRPVMSVGEEIKLLAACSEHLWPIVVAALDTGMRRGELLAQLWEHVDFDRNLLSVSHSKTAEGEHRPIPLTSRVRAMLNEHRKPSGLIFTYEGQPIRRPKSGWTGALRRAGLPSYRFHDLRHTFNSRLVEAGVIADVRKELMGHSRGGDVHSLYTHIDIPVLREAIHRLDQWYAEKVRSLSTVHHLGEESSLPGNDHEKPTESKDEPYDGNQRALPSP